jgi:FMN phosphatase YigB (HAD superfamily)
LAGTLFIAGNNLAYSINNRIESIFIDFDGTMSSDKFWSHATPDLQQFAQHFFFSSNTAVVDSWMRGFTTSEDINSSLANVVKKSYAKIWKDFVSGCESFRVPCGILKCLAELRSTGVKVYVVTDNMDCFTRFTVPALGLLNKVDAIYNSADFGILKKDQISQSLLARAVHNSASDMKKTIFVDNCPKNCAAFKNLGGEAICVDSPSHTEIVLEQAIRLRSRKAV